MRRYDPDYCRIKAILDYGELGKPLIAHCISRTPCIAAGFTNAMQGTNVLISSAGCSTRSLSAVKCWRHATRSLQLTV